MPADFRLEHELRPFIRYADMLDYKSWKTPRRIISDYLLLYVREGRIKLSFDAMTYSLQPDMFVFIQPGTPHQIESESSVSVMALHIELFPTPGDAFTPLLITIEEDLSQHAGRLQPSFSSFTGVEVPVRYMPSKPEWMQHTLQRLIELWSRKTALDVLQAHMHAAELLMAIITDSSTPGTDDTKSLTDLSWVPAYMQYRLAESITVEEMARKAYMSRSYFSLLFRMQFGVAPHQYLLRLRLESALGLLRGTSMPLQEIADSCGFSSVHHFSKMFKQRYGDPPSRVRVQKEKTF